MSCSGLQGHSIRTTTSSLHAVPLSPMSFPSLWAVELVVEVTYLSCCPGRRHKRWDLGNDYSSDSEHEAAPRNASEAACIKQVLTLHIFDLDARGDPVFRNGIADSRIAEAQVVINTILTPKYASFGTYSREQGGSFSCTLTGG